MADTQKFRKHVTGPVARNTFVAALLGLVLSGVAAGASAECNAYGFSVPGARSIPFPSLGACEQGRVELLNSGSDVGAHYAGATPSGCHCISFYNPLPALERQLSGLENQQAALKVKLGRLQQAHSALLNQVQTLNGEIANLQDQISDAHNRNAATRREMFELNKQLALRNIKDFGAPTESRGSTETGGGLGLKPLTEPATGGSPASTHIIVGAWHQLHCSVSISRDAIAQVRKSNSIEKVKYLGQQAADAMNGRPIQVSCDEGESAPAVFSQTASTEYRQYLPSIIDRIETDASDLIKERREYRGVERRLAMARKDINRRRADANRLENEAASPDLVRKKKQADDALAVALRALAKAKRVKKEVEAAASHAWLDLQSINRAEDRVARNPEEVNALFTRIMAAGSTKESGNHDQRPGGEP